jgi:hypothetical protein
MHTGQLFSARYLLKSMQKGEVHRLMADTLRARAEVIAALMGMPDQALDAPIPYEGWTIREMVEHTIFWERHSIDDLGRRKLAGRPEPKGTGLKDVVDPLYGSLPEVNLHDTTTPTPIPDPEAVKAASSQNEHRPS